MSFYKNRLGIYVIHLQVEISTFTKSYNKLHICCYNKIVNISNSVSLSKIYILITIDINTYVNCFSNYTNKYDSLFEIFR